MFEDGFSKVIDEDPDKNLKSVERARRHQQPFRLQFNNRQTSNVELQQLHYFYIMQFHYLVEIENTQETFNFFPGSQVVVCSFEKEPQEQAISLSLHSVLTRHPVSSSSFSCSSSCLDIRGKIVILLPASFLARLLV